jgi:hypothetical protein
MSIPDQIGLVVTVLCTTGYVSFIRAFAHQQRSR